MNHPSYQWCIVSVLCMLPGKVGFCTDELYSLHSAFASSLHHSSSTAAAAALAALLNTTPTSMLCVRPIPRDHHSYYTRCIVFCTIRSTTVHWFRYVHRNSSTSPSIMIAGDIEFVRRRHFPYPVSFRLGSPHVCL